MRNVRWESVVAAVALVFGVAACDLAETVVARGRQPVSLTDELSLHRLGRELWLHTSSTAAGEGANGLVVVGDDAVVVIDMPPGASSTGALFDWIASELRRPVRCVVLTAGERNADGLVELEARGIASIACEGTLRLSGERGGPLPTRSFVRQELLTLDEETIELFHPGPGQSPDNCVVHLRRAKLLFGGNLVRPLEARDLGSVARADLASWPTALRFVREHFSGAGRVIPGAGAPGGQELIDHTLALLEQHGG